MITITIFSVIIVCNSFCPLILLLILYFIFPLIFFLAQYFIRHMHFYIPWSFCLFPPHSLYYLSNVSRYTIFYALCPLLSLKPFFSVSAGAVFSCAIVSVSLVLGGTSGHRQKTNAALGVVLLSVRTSANSSLRPTNRTSDCPPFSTRLPLVSRSRYPNHRRTSGSPFTFPPRRTRVKWTTSRSRRIRGSFFMSLPWHFYFSHWGTSRKGKRDEERTVHLSVYTGVRACLKFNAVSKQRAR